MGPLILPRDLSLKLNTAVLLELTATTPVIFSMINMIRWKTKTINFLLVLQSALTTSLATTVSFLRLISTLTLKINLNSELDVTLSSSRTLLRITRLRFPGTLDKPMSSVNDRGAIRPQCLTTGGES